MEFPEKMVLDSCGIAIVPRYCETDQAGVVHHTVYPIWFEMGRTELLRANGAAYRDLEREGIFFVVTQLTVKYRKPAYYDEELELVTSCSKMTPARIEHSYCLKNSANGLILAEGNSVLACLDRDGKIQRVPEFMLPRD